MVSSSQAWVWGDLGGTKHAPKGTHWEYPTKNCHYNDKIWLGKDKIWLGRAEPNTPPKGDSLRIANKTTKMVLYSSGWHQRSGCEAERWCRGHSTHQPFLVLSIMVGLCQKRVKREKMDMLIILYWVCEVQKLPAPPRIALRVRHSGVREKDVISKWVLKYWYTHPGGSGDGDLVFLRAEKDDDYDAPTDIWPIEE